MTQKWEDGFCFLTQSQPLQSHHRTCKPAAQRHTHFRWVGRKTSTVIQVRHVHTLAPWAREVGLYAGWPKPRFLTMVPDMKSSWKHPLLAALAEAPLWQMDDCPQLTAQWTDCTRVKSTGRLIWHYIGNSSIQKQTSEVHKYIFRLLHFSPCIYKWTSPVGPLHWPEPHLYKKVKAFDENAPPCSRCRFVFAKGAMRSADQTCHGFFTSSPDGGKVNTVVEQERKSELSPC